MSQETFADPRSEITHPIEPGQLYADDRTGDELCIVYEADDAVLLHDTESEWHRLERRRAFEEHVGSDRYELIGSDDAAVASSAVQLLSELQAQYDSEDGRTAAHKASALSEALELVEHGGRPDDNDVIDFETVDGIGSQAASSLRKAGYTTKGDVRSATKDEISDLDYMGQKNTDALLDHVGDN